MTGREPAGIAAWRAHVTDEAGPGSFDPYGPLPEGTVVLEASAGTGKTWTIATLATRYVAEGRAELSELMLVTFGRAATQELRERTRERMTSAARGLADPASAYGDELVKRLAAEDREERHRRLVRALSDFDAATIATTHSFCQRMLDGLGLAGEREPTAALVEEVDDLTREVADDLYLQRYAGHGAAPPQLRPAEARRVALEAVRDRQARLEPATAGPETEAGQRFSLATAARAEVERRKRQRGIRDFDDLLILLRDVLADAERGPAAVGRIRERYRVVLVDEFQDTDPVQWEVLRRAFDGHTTLILIGDPKQAVYAFRGAEVRSYLDAVALAGDPQTLARNWRSDAGLVAALDRLYGGAALGHEQIVVRPVVAHQVEPRLNGQPAFRLRQVLREGRLYQGFPTVPALRQRVADDVADELVRLLDGAARLRDDTGQPAEGLAQLPDGTVPASDSSGRAFEGTGQLSDGTARGPDGTVLATGRAVVPGDVAVLVRTRTQADIVTAALTRAGLPWVLGTSTSVFETPAAVHWLHVLQALEQPHRQPRVRLAALTPLLGRTASQLALASETELAELGLRLREWAALFGRSGFASVYERLAAWSRLEGRLLARPDGERQLTDLRHLAQALDRAAVEQGLGLTALTVWLAERMAEPRLASTTERSRRLDSDAAAVQVLTVHASKGLEFPVVYVPYGWDGARNPSPDSLLLHDDAGVRVRDIGGKSGPGFAARTARHDAEEAGEELRLLYVALTRAQSQVVTWWAPSKRTGGAPLHRLLFARRAGVAEPLPRAPVPEDAVATARLSAWAAAGGLAHEIVGPREGRVWRPSPGASTGLRAADFERTLDEDWRRASYSSLTAAAHDQQGVGSEVEQPGKLDEPAEDPPSAGPPVGDRLPSPDGGAALSRVADSAGDPRSVIPPVGDRWPSPDGGAPPPLTPDPAAGGLLSLMNDLPSGAAFGTLVHEVLETVDTAAPDLAAELQRVCRRAVTARMADVRPDDLAAALEPVLRTPLGLDPDVALADIAPTDRLAELDFELPLAGGDDVRAQMTLEDVAALLRSALPTGDPLAGYADRLAELDAPALRGYLTGSIDMVLRLPGPRYVVVDHKTNRLGTGELTVADFDGPAMAAEMSRQHYPLQALLYAVALHRYLRWRQPAYDPARHLGGVRYLFVRGMVGPATPPGCGVFAWDPPAALVVALSDLLGGRR